MHQEEQNKSHEPEISQDFKNKVKFTRKYSIDMLFMLFAPVVMAAYYYGERSLRLIVLSALTAIVCEYVGGKLFKIYPTVSDLSAVVTGVMIALCLPASSQWWLPCLGSVFAILVVKLPFGNARSLMFSPAAAGIAFLTLSMPDAVFTYPKIIETAGALGFVNGDSIAYMLSQKNSIGINIINYIDILIGNVSGPMGATCGFAMIGAGVFLLIRRPKNAIAPISFVVAAAAIAFIFPRVLTGRLISVYMELSSGLLLFCALFFVSNEVLSPKRTIAKVVYGAAGGIICMIMRRVGVFEDSTVFAVLILNAISPAFDKIRFLTKREKNELQKVIEEEKLLKAKKEQEEKLATWLGDEQIPDEDEVIVNIEISSESVTEDLPIDESDEQDVQNFREINDIVVPENEEVGGKDNV